MAPHRANVSLLSTKLLGAIEITSPPIYDVPALPECGSPACTLSKLAYKGKDQLS